MGFFESSSQDLAIGSANYNKAKQHLHVDRQVGEDGEGRGGEEEEGELEGEEGQVDRHGLASLPGHIP